MKGVLASMRHIDPPLGHARAKWDTSTPVDLTEVIKKLVDIIFSPFQYRYKQIYIGRKIQETVEFAI